MRVIASFFLMLAVATAAAQPQAGEPSKASAKGASAERLPHWYELPWTVRREFPDMKITVHYWNDDPDRRFIKLSDLRVMENESIGSDVWLREIRPASLVLEYKGQRFVMER